MIKNIRNYLGFVVGQLELPDDTPDAVWEAKVAEYAKPPETSQERQYKILKATIKERREYCEDLIERLKAKNIGEGINAMQAMWMHQKFRALSVNFMSVNFTIDLMNLVISGDVEVACLCLMNCTADDMSLPYHWFSQARIDWIVADMKAYLGWA